MGTAYNTNVVTDGIVGCWDAGNRKSYPTTGTTWTDPVGGIKGTLENEDDDALNFNSFKGGYFEFDGTDGRVDCGDAGVDNDLIVDWGELTVCVWALAIQGSQSSYGLVYLGNPFEFSIAPPAHQRFIWATIDGTSLTADVGCMDPYWGKWAHYAVRWVTGTDNYRLYINGEVIKTATFNDTHISPGSNPPLYFAYRGTGKCLEGNIGSVYIYDRALSDDEIKQNYEATKTRFEPRITKSGLVGNWDAGDPESYVGGLTCKDTANGTEATLENNGTNLNFNSANGGYWEFDGTDDYIQCSTDSILQPQSFSVEAWVYDDQTVDNLPIVAWAGAASPTAGWPAVWTSYHGSVQKPYIYMDQWGGADFRDFDATAASVVGWHHVVFTYTYDDITTGAFYVDGVSQSVSSTYDDTKASTDTCRIGLSRGYYYKGSMGLVRIYDRPLSLAEILDNYNKTKARFGH